MKGYNPEFGARPLRRAIENLIEDPLAEEVLRAQFKEGAHIRIVVREDHPLLRPSRHEGRAFPGRPARRDPGFLTHRLLPNHPNLPKVSHLREVVCMPCGSRPPHGGRAGPISCARQTHLGLFRRIRASDRCSKSLPGNDLRRGARNSTLARGLLEFQEGRENWWPHTSRKAVYLMKTTATEKHGTASTAYGGTPQAALAPPRGTPHPDAWRVGQEPAQVRGLPASTTRPTGRAQRSMMNWPKALRKSPLPTCAASIERSTEWIAASTASARVAAERFRAFGSARSRSLSCASSASATKSASPPMSSDDKVTAGIDEN